MLVGRQRRAEVVDGLLHARVLVRPRPHPERHLVGFFDGEISGLRPGDPLRRLGAELEVRPAAVHQVGHDASEARAQPGAPARRQLLASAKRDHDAASFLITVRTLFSSLFWLWSAKRGKASPTCPTCGPLAPLCLSVVGGCVQRSAAITVLAPWNSGVSMELSEDRVKRTNYHNCFTRSRAHSSVVIAGSDTAPTRRGRPRSGD
jgi:hypothetical protein